MAEGVIRLVVASSIFPDSAPKALEEDLSRALHRLSCAQPKNFKLHFASSAIWREQLPHR